MRTETMIAGAVALVSGYNTLAAASSIGSIFGGGPGLPTIFPPEATTLVSYVFVASTAATVWLGAEDFGNAARGNPRPFEPLTLRPKR